VERGEEDCGAAWLALKEREKGFSSSQRDEISQRRVARAPAFAALRHGKSRPWAERFNPVGIGKTNDNAPNITSYSTEISEERTADVQRPS
jgi:hypothetical protein